jgi:hypothetical protein
VSVFADPRRNVRPSQIDHRLIPVDPEVHQLRVAGNRRQQDASDHSRNGDLIGDDVLAEVGHGRGDQQRQQNEVPDRSTVLPEQRRQDLTGRVHLQSEDRQKVSGQDCSGH